MNTSSSARIAGAPISWGVCEVPGWGPMLEAERVLRELASLNLDALELGAPGFLPHNGDEVKSLLDRYGMALVGGFVPVVLHCEKAREATLADARNAAAKLVAGGGTMFVTAVVVDLDWSPRIVLSDAQWQHMYEMLHELDEIAREFGLVQVIHPHVGTLIETADDVNRVLANTSSLWCLDTGHLAMGGTDPVAFAETYGARVGHVHLKDVVLALAEQMNQGDLTLMQATFAGMFCNLGAGDVDVAGVMRSLSARNYTGWYVLEQDISINGEPPREGSGPVEDVAVSLAFARHHLGLAG